MAADYLKVLRETFVRNIRKNNIYKGYKWIEYTIEDNKHNYKVLYIDNKKTHFIISDYGIIKNTLSNKIIHCYTNVYPIFNYNNKTYRLHILVAHTFLPNFNNKECVNHKDGNKENCKVYNLEWISRSNNNIHSTRILKKGNITKVAQYNLEGKLLNVYDSTTIASEKTGILRTSIKNCVNNYVKTSGGYIWKKLI
jgi:hypothetical protein